MNGRTETKFERTMITGQKARERQGRGAESQRELKRKVAESQRIKEKRCGTQRMTGKRCGMPENDREKVRKARE